MDDKGVCKDCNNRKYCEDYKPNKWQCEDYESQHTNEEWFCQLPTEEKAKFFVMIEMTAMHPIKRGAVDMEKFIEEVVEWLKQPHKEKHE